MPYNPSQISDSYAVNAQFFTEYVQSAAEKDDPVNNGQQPYVRSIVTGSCHFYAETNPSDRDIVGIRDITASGAYVDLNDVNMSSGGPIPGGQGVQWITSGTDFKIILQHGGNTIAHPFLYPTSWYDSHSLERTYELTLANGQIITFEIFVRGWRHFEAEHASGSYNENPEHNGSEGWPGVEHIFSNGETQYNPALRLDNQYRLETGMTTTVGDVTSPIGFPDISAAEIGRTVDWLGSSHNSAGKSGFSVGVKDLQRSDNWAYAVCKFDADTINKITTHGNDFYHGRVYFTPAYGSGPGSQTNFQTGPFRTDLFQMADPGVAGAETERTAIFCYETIDHGWRTVAGLGVHPTSNVVYNHEQDNTTVPATGPRSYRREVGLPNPNPAGVGTNPYTPYHTSLGVPASQGESGDFGLGSYRAGAWGATIPAGGGMSSTNNGLYDGHYTAKATTSGPVPPNNATPFPDEGFKAIWIGGGASAPNSYNNYLLSYSDVTSEFYPGYNFDFNRRVPPLISMTLKTGSLTPQAPDPCVTTPLVLDNTNTASNNCTANGANDGTATINETNLIGSGAVPPLTYVWNGPSGVFGGSASFQLGLAPGNYSVDVTDNQGCTDTWNFTITEPAPPPPCDIQHTTSVTYGCGNALLNFVGDLNSGTPVADWVITVTDPNGNALNPSTLTLSGGSGTGSIGLPGSTGGVIVNGTYTYKIEDVNDPSCFINGTIPGVNVVANTLNVAATSTDPTGAGANDGTATALISGGVAPYNTTWSNGQAGNSASGLSPGTYTVTVTDGNGCSALATVVIEEPLPIPLNALPLEVCLNLDTGMFDFVDNNNYSPSGTTYPYRIAISIEHGNGVNVYPGSLASPDIFSDSDLANLRTYDFSINYGQNNSIPIPTSGPNYISDIYKITTEWNFSGGTAAEHTTVSYVNAQGLQLFDELEINLKLKYSCAGDFTSHDKTDYSIDGTPYTLQRTHELFAPIGSGLPSPAYTSGQAIINSDLYEGTWTSSVASYIVWNVPQLPVLGVMYDPLCVKKTLYESKTKNVSCYIDPCVVHHHSKKIKNKYDAAVCDRDIVKIKEYKFKYQRLIELLKIYIIGEMGDCAEDYAELWKMLEITNIDKITDPDCCGDPGINEGLIADGKGTFNSQTNCVSTDAGDTSVNGGGGGGNPGSEPICPCIEEAVAWSPGQQSSGVYVLGDYVNFPTATGDIICLQLHAVPSSWAPSNSSQFPLESPLTDLGQYWEYIPCDGDGGTPEFGCTDSSASNYNDEADYDDGSCVYPVQGCTDSTASNFNPLATIDDGSCIYCIYGCMDNSYLEYDPAATCHDQNFCITSCIYGCTDVTASNFNSLATCDDGSCTSCNTPGCMDPTASNYDPTACVDDGSCMTTIWYGCGDPAAVNYNSGTANGTVVPNCSCLYSGCTDPSATNYTTGSTSLCGPWTAFFDDGSCTYAPSTCTGSLAIPNDPFEVFLEGIGYSDGVSGNNLIDIAGTGPYPSACDLQDMNAMALGISDLTGLTQFTSLVNLYLTNNPFTSIDVTAMPNLERLMVDSTQISSIDLSNNTLLEQMRIGYNPNLTSLDLTNNVALTGLSVPSTGLTGTFVVQFNVNLNMIDVTNNPGITSLHIGSSINLNNLSLFATGLSSSATIKVGSSARVTLANSLFTVANGSISTGTTFIV